MFAHDCLRGESGLSSGTPRFNNRGKGWGIRRGEALEKAKANQGEGKRSGELEERGLVLLNGKRVSLRGAGDGE